MVLREWDKLPKYMQCPEVREYYDILTEKQRTLKVKRALDVLLSSVLLIVLAIPMIVVAVLIKKDSPGPVMYRQERVTTYGRRFRIHKFRTMVDKADRMGSHVTVSGDSRITKIGSRLRKLRIDELPQLIDVLKGDMTFVGTRPEAVKYVKKYTNEMNATLLLPAGVTSEASIRYKGEAELLDAADDVDRVYVEEVLPEKMKYNLASLRNASLMSESMIMLRTIVAVIERDK